MEETFKTRTSRKRARFLGSIIVLLITLAIAGVAQFNSSARADFQALNRTRTVYGGSESVATEPPERAIFGRQPQHEAKVQNPEKTLSKATEPPDVSSGTTASVASYGYGVPSDIRAFLERWRTTLVAGAVQEQADLYAPQVDRFFNMTNVSRDFVRQEKQKLISEYPEVKRYTISDVRVESLGGDYAVVSFRKDWDARGARRFAGAERQRLHLRRIRTEWKIVREEETKVYWVRKT